MLSRPLGRGAPAMLSRPLGRGALAVVLILLIVLAEAEVWDSAAHFDKYDRDNDDGLDLEEYKKMLKDEWYGETDLDDPAHEAPWSEADREEIYKMQEHFVEEDRDQDTMISRAEFLAFSAVINGMQNEECPRRPCIRMGIDPEAAMDEDAPDEDAPDGEDEWADVDLEEGIIDEDDPDAEELDETGRRVLVGVVGGDEAHFKKYDRDSDGNLDLEEYKKLLKDEWHGETTLDEPAHEPPWSLEDRDEIYKMQELYMEEDYNKDTMISLSEFLEQSSRLEGRRNGHRRPGVESIPGPQPPKPPKPAPDRSMCGGGGELEEEEVEMEEEFALSVPLGGGDDAHFKKYDRDSDGNLDLEEYKKLLKDEWHGETTLDEPAHEPPWSLEDRDEIYKMQELYMEEDYNKDTMISLAEFLAQSARLEGKRDGHRRPGVESVPPPQPPKPKKPESEGGNEMCGGGEELAEEVELEEEIELEAEIELDDEIEGKTESALAVPLGGGDEAHFQKYDRDSDGNLDLEEYKKLLKDEWHGETTLDEPAHEPPWSLEDRDEIYKMQELYMEEDYNKDTMISLAEFLAQSARLEGKRDGHRRPGVESVPPPQPPKPKKPAPDRSMCGGGGELEEEGEGEGEGGAEVGSLVELELEDHFEKYDRDSDEHLDLEEYKKLLKDEWHGETDIAKPAHEVPWSLEDREEIYKMQEHFVAEDRSKDAKISLAEFIAMAAELDAGDPNDRYRWTGHGPRSAAVQRGTKAGSKASAEIDLEDLEEESWEDDVDLADGIVEEDELEEEHARTTASKQAPSAKPAAKKAAAAPKPKAAKNDEVNREKEVASGGGGGSDAMEAHFQKYDRDSDGNLDLEEYKKLLKDEWHGETDIAKPAHEAPWSTADREEIYKMQERFMEEDWNKDTMISLSEFLMTSSQLEGRKDGHRRPGRKPPPPPLILRRAGQRDEL